MASTKIIRILYYMGRRKKDGVARFKVGDKVTSSEYQDDRIFELVWYQDGDATCAIQDESLRAICKVYFLLPHPNVEK